MPLLEKSFREKTYNFLELAEVSERIRVQSVSAKEIQKELTPPRLHLIYEMAYLRVFAQWETFLEDSFLRYLCGYTNSNGQQSPVTGIFHKTLFDAQRILFRNRSYLLWHDPNRVIQRSQNFFKSGLHETILLSNQARLQWFADIRHRIAHDQSDARYKFDRACMNLCGRRFRGGRPGVFLRDWTFVAGQRMRWLQTISEELCNLAGQITP